MCPYSELFWPAFSPIRTKYGMQTRITPNTDTFHAVIPRKMKSNLPYRTIRDFIHLNQMHVNFMVMQNYISYPHLEQWIAFSIWVFFHQHSRFTGQQGKGEATYLTPLCYFHLLHRHFDASQAITAESSPLRIVNSQT